MNVLVIGGGLFGSCIAIELASQTHKVTLIDKSPTLMSEASRCNHNRIHFGYHYPRSLLTAKQSIEGLLSFLIHFRDAIVTEFPNYYAIAKEKSHVSTTEFTRFCEEAGISYVEEYPAAGFLAHDMLDSCFRVNEPIFDYQTLASIVRDRLLKNKVQVLLKTQPMKIQSDVTAGGFKVDLDTAGRYWAINQHFDFVVNATYAGLNDINSMVGAKPLNLLYEDVMIPVFRHDRLPRIGLTVMDGPFCTIMPQGLTEGNFLLYNVETSVYSRAGKKEDLHIESDFEKLSMMKRSIYDTSLLFLPFLEDTQDVDEYRTIRTVYENKADARLSEVHTYPGIDRYISVLSGKISTAMKTALQVKGIVDGTGLGKNYVI